MSRISGFSMIHNAIDSGYPIIEAVWAIADYVDEVVVVDMASTDETREVLSKLGVRIIDGQWGNKAGQTLGAAYDLHCQCTYDTILHFEADEVYDETLADELTYQIVCGKENIGVWRLQVEQNFQRCRWYPEVVHRVFKKGTMRKDGHTTDYHTQKHALDVVNPIYGYLWDCTNIFRNSWFRRVEKQAELWNEIPRYRMVPKHFMQDINLHREAAFYTLNEEHWTFDTTPFDLPVILGPLVGYEDYRDTPNYKSVMGK